MRGCIRSVVCFIQLWLLLNHVCALSINLDNLLTVIIIQKCKIQIVRRITIKDLIVLLPQNDILCCDQIIYFKRKCVVKIYEGQSNTMCTSNNKLNSQLQ